MNRRLLFNRHILMVVSALSLASVPLNLAAQNAPKPTEEPATLSRDCPVSSAQVATRSPLPNIARALKERRRIIILTIGTSSTTSRDPRGSHHNLIETYLETTFKGLDVEIIDRGVSGELAKNASARMKLEVALNSADLVLWQVGTFDAMAQVPLPEFERTLTDTARWLKGHNVDLVLVGMHYLRGLRANKRYQAFRDSMKSLAAREKILRIGRYEAGEIIEKARSGGKLAPDEFRLTEESYLCVAEVIARALATSLFAKPEATPVPQTSPPPAVKQ